MPFINKKMLISLIKKSLSHVRMTSPCLSLTTIQPELGFLSGADHKPIGPFLALCQVNAICLFLRKDQNPFGSHLRTALSEQEKDNFE